MFVIDNNNKNNVYSNQYIKTLDEYIEKTKNNYWSLKINFGTKDTELIKNGKKSIYTLNKATDPIAEKRKENVTTYISIPHIKDIKTLNVSNYYNDEVYQAYKQYSAFKLKNEIFLGSKLLSIIIIPAALILLRKINKKNKDNSKSINENSILGKKITSIAILLIANGILGNIDSYIHIDDYTGLLLLNSLEVFRVIIFGYIIYNLYKLVKEIIYIDKNKKGFLVGLSSIYKKYVSNKNIKLISIISCIGILLTIIEIVLSKKIVSSATYYYSGMVTDFSHIKIIIWLILFKNALVLIFIIHNLNKIIEIDIALKEIKGGNLKYKIDVKW